MRIDELKKIAEENYYVMTDLIAGLRFTKKDNENHITIGSKSENTIWISIQDWCFEEDFKMVKAAVEFAETPLEDREEEKKFYLRHKYIRFIDGSAEYYTTCTSQKFPLLEYKAFSDGFNQQFTLKEIEEIKERFDTDLADFELVEVEDDFLERL